MHLSTERQQVADMARRCANEQIWPQAERLEREGAFAADISWIHNAPVADVAFVLARTDPAAGKRGMSIFIVDCALAGVTREAKENEPSQRSSPVGELPFDNVALPADALPGLQGRGFQMMTSVLDEGRVGIAALAAGILQAALEASIAQARVRKQSGLPIAGFQRIPFMLAGMAKDTEAARLPVGSAAQQRGVGVDATAAAAMAKCFAGDAAVAHSAMQIFGASGCILGCEVERPCRDAKIRQVHGGASQIRRRIIARKSIDG